MSRVSESLPVIFETRRALGSPIRSIFPDSKRYVRSLELYKANLILEEPALIVSTVGADWTCGSAVSALILDDLSVCILGAAGPNQYQRDLQLRAEYL